MKTLFFTFALALALPVAVQAVPGATPFATAALTNTLVVASAAGSTMTGYNFANTSAGQVFVQFFDAPSTSGITLGTTAPKFWIAVAQNGVTDGVQAASVAFQTGIVMAVTTTPTGSTAPSVAVPAVIFKN